MKKENYDLVNYILAAAVLVFVGIAPLAAQTGVDYPSFRLDAAPTVAFPLTEDVDYFGTALGANVTGLFTTPFLPPLSLGFEAGYSVNLLAGNHGDQLSTIRGGGLVRFSPFLAPRLQVSLGGGGGYYYSFLNQEPDQAGSNPYLAAGGGISLVLGKTKGISVGLEGMYRNYLGFFQEVGITLSTSLNLGKRIAPAGRDSQVVPVPESKPSIQLLQFDAFQAEPLFPTMSKYYSDNSFGTVTVINPNPYPVTNLEVSFFVNRYMDSPKECARIDTLGPGESREVPLYGLFNTAILDVYEKSKVNALVRARYTADGESRENESSFTIDIFDRNALVWDDDRKPSAFVTAKDPVVMKFAKNIMSQVDISNAINGNLYRGMAVFTALEEYGTVYNIDPSSSYEELSGNSTAVDYLQYPRQTLDYKSGDCDDLTVLNAALMQALGIPTAFITVPGHIYLAFSLGITPAEAARSFINPENLIMREDEVWLPLEITLLGSGFLRAWDTGASQWRSAVAEGSEGFFLVEEAWEIYESVAFFEDTGITPPDGEGVARAFQREASNLVGFQLAPKIASLEARLQNNPRPFLIHNAIGVLYARYGQLEQARQAFTESLELNPEYVPSLLNLGNLYLLEGEYQKSVEVYQNIINIDGTEAKALISLALAYRKMGDFTQSLRSYNKARELAPGLAEKYAYLGPGASGTERASSSVMETGDLLWAEE